MALDFSRVPLGRVGAACAGAAALVLATAGVGVAHAHKSVTVSVDGATREVTTFATAPGQVLAEAGVDVGRHDAVSTPSKRLSSGDTITVTSATSVVVEGKAGPTRTWLAAPTLLEAAHDVRGAAPKILPLSHASALTTKELGSSHALRLAHDGREDTVEAPGEQSAAEVLKRAGVALGHLDRLSLDVTGSTPVLRVERVTRECDHADTITKHTIREVADDSLARGTREVDKAGEDGISRTQTFTETVDGTVVFRRASDAAEIQPMVEEVVRVGTKAEPEPAAGSPVPAASQGSAPSGGVWAALAQCESGGNPAAVSANGLYHGLYQFSVSTWRAVGGSGLPSQASAAEQTHRAQILQQRAGWGQWPACARSLGLY